MVRRRLWAVTVALALATRALFLRDGEWGDAEAGGASALRFGGTRPARAPRRRGLGLRRLTNLAQHRRRRHLEGSAADLAAHAESRSK